MYFTIILAASEQNTIVFKISIKCVKVAFYKQFLMVLQFWGDVVSLLT